jgi:hypothetical protein
MPGGSSGQTPLSPHGRGCCSVFIRSTEVRVVRLQPEWRRPASSVGGAMQHIQSTEYMIYRVRRTVRTCVQGDRILITGLQDLFCTEVQIESRASQHSKVPFVLYSNSTQATSTRPPAWCGGSKCLPDMHGSQSSTRSCTPLHHHHVTRVSTKLGCRYVQDTGYRIRSVR